MKNIEIEKILKEFEGRIMELELRNMELENKIENINVGSKSIKSERKMTEDDAKRIINGDLKGKSNKEVANELKLSYGQVYSCRNGYTFRYIKKI